MLCSSSPKPGGLQLSETGHILESHGIGRIHSDESSKQGLKCFSCLHFPAVSLLCFILKLLWQDCCEVYPHSEGNSLCLFEAAISFLTSLMMSWKMLLLRCQLSSFPENTSWLNGATLPGGGLASGR